jgi:hypothetical protein
LARNKYTSDRIDEEIFSGEESYLVDENLLEDTLDIESLSLESILAEYKGSAYIDGDRKTPPDILDEKTKRIILEETGRLEKTRSAEPTPELEQTAFAQEGTAVKISQPDTTADSGVIPLHSIRNDYIDSDLWGDGTRPYTGTVTEETLYSAGAFEDEYEPEEPEKKRRRGLFGRLRGGYEVETAALEYDDEDEYDDYAYYEDEFEDEEIEVPVLEEEIFEEPDFKVATRRFAALCNAYSVRFFFSFLVSAVMVIVTLVYNGKNPLDERSTFIATGILLILLLLSMIIGIDQMIYGIVRLFRKQAGYETLNFFACLAAAAAAAYALITKNFSTGLPYCAAASMTITAGLWGEKIHYRAFTETMKTATSASIPGGVVTEVADEINRIVTRKVPSRTGGFYNRLVTEDIAERTYKVAAPMLVAVSVVLALYAGIAKQRYSDIPFYLAALLTAATPLSASAAFALPFFSTARRLRKAGAAVAGWGGAEDLFTSDGTSVTDDDLFPPENISVSGVRVFDNVSPERAVRYTASMIAASGSGLARLFTKLASKQGSTLMKVDDFTCYEGGIGGTIRGDRVFTGNAAFMKLMGIRIPPNLNLKNAAFTAINKRLIAVFILEYVPVKSVQYALVALLRHRVRLFFAVRDFGIMPVMLEQKYKISVDDVEYLPIRSSYELSDIERMQTGRVAALLAREGLLPFAESVTGARRLRNTAKATTVFSVFSAVAGIVIMFIISWIGGGAASGAANLMLYMLSMLVAFLFIGGFAKYQA